MLNDLVTRAPKQRCNSTRCNSTRFNSTRFNSTRCPLVLRCGPHVRTLSDGDRWCVGAVMMMVVHPAANGPDHGSFPGVVNIGTGIQRGATSGPEIPDRQFACQRHRFDTNCGKHGIPKRTISQRKYSRSTDDCAWSQCFLIRRGCRNRPRGAGCCRSCTGATWPQLGNDPVDLVGCAKGVGRRPRHSSCLLPLSAGQHGIWYGEQLC
jgi:hypothetical protein